MIQTSTFARKPFHVQAVQVTADNMEDVAEWCKGTVVTHAAEKFVKVKVHRPLTDRQTKGYPGDWILSAGSGFKVYTPNAFKQSFDPVQVIDEHGATSTVTHRDAGTGKYVTEEYAEENPETTVTETDELEELRVVDEPADEEIVVEAGAEEKYETPTQDLRSDSDPTPAVRPGPKSRENQENPG